MKKTIAIIIALSSLAFTVIYLQNWNLKEDAYFIKFNGLKVDGYLKGLKTTILFDESHLENSKLTATLDAKTINTSNWLKNKHAKSEEGLNVESFPVIKFESAKITSTTDGYNAVGQLTIKGTTKTINLPFTFLSKGNESIFKGKMKITPRDFNIIRHGTPEIIEVEISVPVTN